MGSIRIVAVRGGGVCRRRGLGDTHPGRVDGDRWMGGRERVVGAPNFERYRKGGRAVCLLNSTNINNNNNHKPEPLHPIHCAKSTLAELDVFLLDN